MFQPWPSSGSTEKCKETIYKDGIKSGLCKKSTKWLEIADEALLSQTDIKVQILVEIWELPDVQCFF